MRSLFDEIRINKMVVPNRLVRSATWEGMCAPDGRPTAKLDSYYRSIARGGVGMIITGYAYVRPEGKQLPGMMGAHRDFQDDLRTLADAVHEEGARICLQIVHAGGQTAVDMAGRRPLAPSAVAVAQYQDVPEELSVDEIKRIVESFAAAALRGKEAGFDAVQLHAAHGYLINQFLSPLTNRRTDHYGGDIDNRSRFLMEVYREVRKAVGSDYPVIIKLNGSDNLDGGFDLEDALVVARMLDEEGIDAIEVSAGTPASGDRTPVRQKIDSREQEAYNLPQAERVKGVVTCPVMVVGGLKSFEIVEGIIRRNEADFVCFSRPLIREPDLPRKWRDGDESKARCISCNGCFRPGLRDGGIYCVVEKIERESSRESL